MTRLKLLTQHKLYQFISCYIIYFVGFFLIFLIFWLKKEFGDVTFEQVVYHLQFGSEGILSADDKMVRSFYLKCLITPSSLAFCFSMFNADVIRSIKHVYFKIKNILLTMLLKFEGGQKLISVPSRYYFLAAAIIYAFHQLGVFSYMADTILPSGKDFYAEQYKSPSTTHINAAKPRNLVLIYVESLESTYSDQKVFNEDLVQKLSVDSLGGLSFTQQRQISGTGWTMAGIVSTQCGIPLKAAFGGGDRRKNDLTEVTSSFLPNIKCLGDVLKEHHFHNVFMGGASLKFAGKGNFFQSHGYDEAYGREEFISIYGSKLALNHWGIYDDDLFKIAKEKIDVLQKQATPYNLTLLTLDMHQPEGNLSKTCIAAGAIKFKDIVRCTANSIADLVSYMGEKGYLENTTVVILGDHLAMTNPLIKKLQKSAHRRVFNLYITKNMPLVKNRNEITHVDHLPSILDSINLKVEGGQLGLGISGFSSQKIADTQDRFKLLDHYGTKTSKTYMEFWIKPTEK